MTRRRGDPEDVARAKQAVRERVWSRLESEGVARFPGARGRIPNFRGAEAAAERLAGLRVWRDARVVKANPDAPQLPVRARALDEGKVLYMAVPRLAEHHPFLAVEAPAGGARRAASIRGASRAGRPVAVEQMQHVDLIVCGSVAVSPAGARVGKGGGYSDLEFALLAEAGLVDDATVIVTTVHPVQLEDGPLPETRHDFRVDRIVTPEETTRSRRRRRPPGVLWEDVNEAKVGSIPVLAALARARR